MGVAIDESNGRIYVVERLNHRVSVFDSNGGFIKVFGSSDLAEPIYVGIDENPASSSYRDLYVSDAYRVVKFDPEGNKLLEFGSKGTGNGQFSRSNSPISVGPGGIVYVLDAVPNGPLQSEGYTSRIEKFSPAGIFLAAVQLGGTDASGAQLAVDSTGSIYTTYSGGGLGVLKFDATGNELYALDPGAQISAIGLDGVDHLFAQEALQGELDWEITEWDESGTARARFAYGEMSGGLKGLDVGPSGKVVGTEWTRNVSIFTPPPPGPLVSPTGLVPDPLGNAYATLNAKINPEGKATTYHFEYITVDDFQANGNSFGAGTLNTPESSPLGPDVVLHDATAPIGCPNPAVEASEAGNDCLSPETEYRFRVTAKDSEDHETTLEAAPFTTRPPLEIDGVWATEVSTDSARLHAEVNPLGLPATGQLQYVDEAHFQSEGGFASPHTQTIADFDFGSGEAPLERHALISDLSPGTGYRYRIVLTNPLLSEPLAGSTHSLVTQAPPTPPPSTDPCPNTQFRSGASADLPDCRAYEMVSPVDKEGADILSALVSLNYPAALGQSAASGTRLTYSAYRAFGDAQSSPYVSQYIAARDPEVGWLTHGISPPRGFAINGIALSFDAEFKAFSADLCTGWLVHDADPPLADGAIEGFTNFYKSDLCGAAGYTTLTTVQPPHTLPAGLHVEPQGSSADGSVAIYGANDALTANAPTVPENVQLLYAARGGKPRLVCVLPGGAAIGPTGCAAGAPYYIQDNRHSTVAHAISDDGSRVFWTAASGGLAPIYARENPLGAGAECSKPTAPCTLAVSGSVASGNARFWTASADGSRVIFTGEQGSFAGDLYEFEVATETPTLIAHNVKSVGVWGASEDASRIYFTSEEVLDQTPNSQGESALAGEPNLYLYEAAAGGSGSFDFIATLSAPELTQLSETTPITRRARVSPDGRHLAFMSTAPIGDYDNTDAISGKPDAEIYLYQAGGQLHCISCNPTGARPVGRQIIDGAFPTGIWAAARIPVAENQLYAPRALSADGPRLFFESADALLARDTNGRQDVYEWEEASGVAECEEAGAELYVARAGGCLSLISSGQSPADSRFVDASADGADVFISTGSSLLPQDPGLVDVYDARVGGGFPIPPAPPAACEGEACQSPSLPPDDPTPASSSFEGAGNLHQAAKRKCAKGRVLRHGNCTKKPKLKRSRKPQGHHKRRAKR
jgi:DNA-binding beta-propeller fold protein YncE